MSSPYFLEMTNISKTFPGAKVLDRIDIRVKPGEVRALMGENGAWKIYINKNPGWYIQHGSRRRGNQD